MCTYTTKKYCDGTVLSKTKQNCRTGTLFKTHISRDKCKQIEHVTITTHHGGGCIPDATAAMILEKRDAARGIYYQRCDGLWRNALGKYATMEMQDGTKRICQNREKCITGTVSLECGMQC